MEKKKKTGLIIGIAAAFVIVAAVAVFLVGTAYGRRPEVKLKLAATNMKLELAQYGRPISGGVDIEAFNRLKNTHTIHSNTDVSITIPDSEIKNVSVNVDALTSVSAKRANYAVKAGMYGFQVPLADFALTSDTLYASLPILLADTYSLGLTNLGEEFNKSEWASLFEAELPEDYAVEPFCADDGGEAARELLYTIWQSGAVVRENISYTYIKEKKAGSTGVRVTADKDAVNQFMEGLRDDILKSDFYTAHAAELTGSAVEEFDAFIDGLTSIRFETDGVLDIYLDEAWRIVNISTPSDIKTQDGSEIAIDISFSGEKRALDVISGGLYIKSGEEIAYVGIERNASVDDALYSENIRLLLQTDGHDEDVELSYINDIDKEAMSFAMELGGKTSESTLSLKADGEFSDIVQGESFTLHLNNATLTSDGEELCYLSAVMEVEPSEEEPEIPETAVNILEMDADEILGMTYEVLGSVRNLNYE